MLDTLINLYVIAGLSWAFVSVRSAYRMMFKADFGQIKTEAQKRRAEKKKIELEYLKKELSDFPDAIHPVIVALAFIVYFFLNTSLWPVFSTKRALRTNRLAS